MKYEVHIKFRKDFVQANGNILEVGVMAKPEKGKANKEAVKKIAAFFNVAPSRVHLIAGAKSKKKIIEVN